MPTDEGVFKKNVLVAVSEQLVATQTQCSLSYLHKLRMEATQPLKLDDEQLSGFGRLKQEAVVRSYQKRALATRISSH